MRQRVAGGGGSNGSKSKERRISFEYASFDSMTYFYRSATRFSVKSNNKHTADIECNPLIGQNSALLLFNCVCMTL